MVCGFRLASALESSGLQGAGVSTYVIKDYSDMQTAMILARTICGQAGAQHPKLLSVTVTSIVNQGDLGGSNLWLSMAMLC